jgi:hypothetical protein
MQPTRHRAAATAVAALFAATPLAFGAAAYADGTVQESGSSVTFSGDGLLGVACKSTASASSVTVPAESSLRVVNNTGHRAKLLLDGATKGEVAKGASADVLFHRGPVSLALKPDCVLADESSVRVEVVAAPTVQQPAPPATNPGAPVTGGSSGGTSSTGSAGGSAHQGGATAGTGTRTSGSAGTATAPDARGAAPSAAARPGEEADPAQAGVAPTPAAGTETAAAIDGLDDSATDQSLDNTTTVSGAAAEPLASVEPVSETGRTGLLALIATVCAVGVSAGAIRAIIAQRATRTRTA